jgi:hypothetical protein
MAPVVLVKCKTRIVEASCFYSFVDEKLQLKTLPLHL